MKRISGLLSVVAVVGLLRPGAVKKRLTEKLRQDGCLLWHPTEAAKPEAVDQSRCRVGSVTAQSEIKPWKPKFHLAVNKRAKHVFMHRLRYLVTAYWCTRIVSGSISVDIRIDVMFDRAARLPSRWPCQDSSPEKTLCRSAAGCRYASLPPVIISRTSRGSLPARRTRSHPSMSKKWKPLTSGCTNTL